MEEEIKPDEMQAALNEETDAAGAESGNAETFKPESEKPDVQVRAGKKEESGKQTQSADKKEEAPQEQLTLYKRPKREGKFVQKRPQKELDAMQRKKSLFMYLGTLFFAVSLFLTPAGRERLNDWATSGKNALALSLETLYLIVWVALIVLSVYVSVMNRTWQKIGPELREKNTPRDGLDRHTFVSYEFFNVLHILSAAGEIAVSVLRIDVWGVLNIIAAIASAVCAFLSRQILFKANKDSLVYVPKQEDE